jgi:hypothetical protein
MLSKPNLEETRRHGVEELDTLRGMVLAWREHYFQSAPARGGEDYLFLCQDFSGEIEEYICPYVSRMLGTDHIDQYQAREFLDFCFRQVSELQDYLDLGDGSPD